MLNRCSAIVLVLSICSAIAVACGDASTPNSARTRASCPGFDHGPTQGLPIDSGRGDLAGAVRTFVSTIRGEGSQDYDPPSHEQQHGFASAWREAVAHPMSRDALAAFGYDVFLYEDTGDESSEDGSNRWIVGCERRSGSTGWDRGWGLYLSNGPGRTTVVEVPHPRADARSEDIGVSIVRRTGGDLLIAGAHRNAHREFDDDRCSDEGLCADMSHQRASIFQAVHNATIKPSECPRESPVCRTGLVVVQPHGFATRLHQGIGDVAISDGTADPLMPGSVIDAVADGLEAGGFPVCRFEAPGDCAGTTEGGDPGTTLGATKNVQGQSARESAVPVAFIHVEVSSEVRGRDTGDLSRQKVSEIVGSAVHNHAGR